MVVPWKAIGPLLTSGMRVTIDALESFDRSMRVDLRRAEGRVAQHLLHAPQVRASVHHVRRKGVAQGVNAEAPGATRRVKPVDPALDRGGREPPAPATHEHRLTIRPLDRHALAA